MSSHCLCRICSVVLASAIVASWASRIARAVPAKLLAFPFGLVIMPHSPSVSFVCRNGPCARVAQVVLTEFFAWQSSWTWCIRRIFSLVGGRCHPPGRSFRASYVFRVFISHPPGRSSRASYVFRGPIGLVVSHPQCCSCPCKRLLLGPPGSSVSGQLSHECACQLGRHAECFLRRLGSLISCQLGISCAYRFSRIASAVLFMPMLASPLGPAGLLRFGPAKSRVRLSAWSSCRVFCSSG
jgi:hypothetical protein